MGGGGDDWPKIARNPCLGAIERSAKAREHHRERYPVNGELERLVRCCAIAVTRRRSCPFPASDWRAGRRGAVGEVASLRPRRRHADVDEAAHRDEAEAAAPVATQRRGGRDPARAEGRAAVQAVRVARRHRLRKAWVAILKAADVTDLRVHDLRHWHASLLAGMGLSLPLIGAALGHSSQGTTQRYTALVDERVAQGDGRARRAGRPRGAAAMIARDWLIIEATPWRSREELEAEVEQLQEKLDLCMTFARLQTERLVERALGQASLAELHSDRGRRLEARSARCQPGAIGWCDWHNPAGSQRSRSARRRG